MKRVAIVGETALASGRAILGGIARFLHERDDWSVHHRTGPLGSLDATTLLNWSGDGIIARIANPALLRLVSASGVPVVDVLGNERSSPFPVVKSDDRQIGAIAAERFMENGHPHFAFLGLAGERWSIEREEAFRDVSAPRARTYTVHLLHPAERQAGGAPGTVEKIAAWLRSAPKPLALMVATDQYGPLVLEACHRLEISVPEEVAIVSVDNDLPFCNLCQPRLSSIEPNHEGIGYAAAHLLDRLMEGSTDQPTTIEVAPLTLHRRLSSDTTAVSDPNLVKALQCIREQACEGISVDIVAAAAGLSRSVLQRRFRDQLGRTVGDALLQTKLRRARDMLTFTDLPLLDVAERSGFNYQEYLTQVFNRHLHTTPARYRRQAQSAVREPSAGSSGNPA